MAWKKLKENYTDAVWAGKRKYKEIQNSDSTVSFDDVTEYTNKENSFFGATDANQMNKAMNLLMGMVENGTNLYDDFQIYFSEQKQLFADETEKITVEYNSSMNAYMNTAQDEFTTWFDHVKGQLSTDVAGNLQNQIDTLSWSRNTIYRGNHLGASFPTTGVDLVLDVTDLYIGDYIITDGYCIVIADTKSGVTTLAIIPTTSVSAQMNSTVGVTGGYITSDLFTTSLNGHAVKVEDILLQHYDVCEPSIIVSNNTDMGVQAGQLVFIPDQEMITGCRTIDKRLIRSGSNGRLALFNFVSKLRFVNDFWLCDYNDTAKRFGVYANGTVWAAQATERHGIVMLAQVKSNNQRY